MKKIRTLLVPAGLLFLGQLSAAFAAQPAPQPIDGVVLQYNDAVQHDHLPSLRGVMPKPDEAATHHVRDWKQIPHLNAPGSASDAVQQKLALTSPGAAVVSSASPGINGINGVGAGFTGPNGAFTVMYAPPDTSGAVGPTQYVQVVNTGLAVFDKTTGQPVLGPVPTNVLWQGVGNQCATSNDGDAVVQFDKQAQRWIVTQFAVTSTPYLQCVAVSATADATGAWYRYAFSYGTVFPDYPKLGVWSDGYYMTFNMFNGNTFSGALACSYERSQMLNNGPARQICFQFNSNYASLLPADIDGAIAPPAGAPNYLLNRLTTSSLGLYRFHADWNNPNNSTLTGVSVPVASYSAACGGGTCIPQAGTGNRLDSLADRLMYRAAYRRFADGHESLVVNHSVWATSSTGSRMSGIRWYELRNPGGTPIVYQQSTYAPDANYRWMGSVAMDKQGNLAAGYSVSSASMKPSLRLASRAATDALNTLSNETTIIQGTGAQTGGLTRWGDYTQMAVDPTDDCTFWFTGQYLTTNGSFNWSTRIASFKVATCQ